MPAIIVIAILYVILVIIVYKGRKRIKPKKVVIIAILASFIPLVIIMLAIMFWPDLRQIMNFN